MIWLWQVPLAFFGMVALDFVWARYTLNLVKKYHATSGGYAATIMLLNGVVTLTYVHDPWMILPAAVGAFVGTYLGGKLEKWLPWLP
jgi:uncharacterized membrane protein YfcA